MASASVTPAVTEAQTIIVEPEVVHLSLDPDETKFLVAVLSRIGGDKTKSRRRHAVALQNALRQAGVPAGHYRDREDVEPDNRAIYFLPTN